MSMSFVDIFWKYMCIYTFLKKGESSTGWCRWKRHGRLCNILQRWDLDFPSSLWWCTKKKEELVGYLVCR
jgi:hypothetical protein